MIALLAVAEEEAEEVEEEVWIKPSEDMGLRLEEEDEDENSENGAAGPGFIP